MTEAEWYIRLGTDGWAVCCESSLRQAEKPESSWENVVEGCNNSLVRIRGK